MINECLIKYLFSLGLVTKESKDEMIKSFNNSKDSLKEKISQDEMNRIRETLKLSRFEYGFYLPCEHF